MPATVSPGAADDDNRSRRISVEEYHEMIRAGILGEDDPVELLEGYLVMKLPRGVAHDFTTTSLRVDLRAVIPDDWVISMRCGLTLADSEPEPDFTVAKGPLSLFRHRHPGPADTALVVEVSASSLARDRGDKGRIYARAGIPVYWVVNVVDRQVEVFTGPSGPCDAPAYAKQDVYAVGAAVPVVLDGTTTGTVAVADVMG